MPEGQYYTRSKARKQLENIDMDAQQPSVSVEAEELEEDVVMPQAEPRTEEWLVHDQLAEKAQVQDLATTGEKLMAVVEKVPEQVVARPVKDPSTNGSYIYPFIYLGAYYKRCDSQLCESCSKYYIGQSRVPIMGQSRNHVNNFDWEVDYEVMQVHCSKISSPDDIEQLAPSVQHGDGF
uniref:Uncharacterized protein n=1 Tax=Timema bartmani TaxID=61472 RepID=A0A7R9F7J9_9NEOP|nr:unnamed protein product [Timema bartmani]